MTKEGILAQLISSVLTGKYVLHEVRRSNYGDLQEYSFVIKKIPSQGILKRKKAMTKEEFEKL